MNSDSIDVTNFQVCKHAVNYAHPSVYYSTYFCNWNFVHSPLYNDLSLVDNIPAFQAFSIIFYMRVEFT